MLCRQYYAKSEKLIGYCVRLKNKVDGSQLCRYHIQQKIF